MMGRSRAAVFFFSWKTPVIGRLVGLLAEKNPPQLLIDCNGVGYEVDVPMSTFYSLPSVGEKVTLLTHFVVREDAQILYGFGSATEREAFRQLIRISGVGPRTALAVLSGMSVTELGQAVTRQESGRLVKVPGIGKKTAGCWSSKANSALTWGLPRRRLKAMRPRTFFRPCWPWATTIAKRQPA